MKAFHLLLNMVDRKIHLTPEILEGLGLIRIHELSKSQSSPTKLQ